ncbi:MAG: EamA family transporter, partial [Quisquiliibacterium sp.]
MNSQTFPRRALILVILLTLVWGTNWPMFRLAVQEISVWTFRAVSVPIAGLAILTYARISGNSLRVPRR